MYCYLYLVPQSEGVSTCTCTSEVAITVVVVILIECLIAAPIIATVMAICWRRKKRYVRLHISLSETKTE